MPPRLVPMRAAGLRAGNHCTKPSMTSVLSEPEAACANYIGGISHSKHHRVSAVGTIHELPVHWGIRS